MTITKNAFICIGTTCIGEKSNPFIIAEIGNNHNGSVELAKKLVDHAKAAGADCAKFQMRHMTSLYRNDGNADDASEDLGTQYTLDLLSRNQLNDEDLFAVFDYCHEVGIIPLCTPFDPTSLNKLEKYGMTAYKLASADLTNHELIKEMAKTGKPLICSTGMSAESEIIETVQLLKKLQTPYVLLHCNSTYPAPFKDINLNYLDRLRKIGDCPVGYSGHERGIHVAVAAVAKGAKVIEKHITLDKNMEGSDHKVSLLPHEFATMVQGIREVQQALGASTERKVTQGELMNRENLAKSLVINRDLKSGEIIRQDMIEVKSPGRGLQPNLKDKLIGMRAKRDFKKGDFFFSMDLTHEVIRPRPFEFGRPWGVPVRYHDFQNFTKLSNPDLLEFHLSYKDMDVDFNPYFNASYDMDYVVHSPELFAGDFILDLGSTDEEYRKRSVRELQRVIDITRGLKRYFRRASRPLIVTNAGGFTVDAPLWPEQRKPLYDLVVQSLSELDMDGVEIIPQTMPPFPWHFGGQRYHNLFMDPDEIVEFCTRNGYRVCLDTSHSKLTCNYFNLRYKSFIDKVGPFAAHLHIVDASGTDGEGLQIGEGDIDFASLAEDLDRCAPHASFIPEIWQGHKNDGEGFWHALKQLEKWF
ncbi:N-acetylneuraminate synthase family protein [Paenibacillus beijingensis]|uniref:N-acetylneuraminate synthase family protein n=1 Tax=Paenibacillus beijingensis TaxID=1126833 RepID=UPI0009E3F175|nr:N-acetylneuraminate synthase family protein [Paenibacillus beijingensis]